MHQELALGEKLGSGYLERLINSFLRLNTFRGGGLMARPLFVYIYKFCLFFL